MQLCHVVESAAASTAARLHQVAVPVAPYIEGVVTDVDFVLQDGRACVVKVHVRTGQAVVAAGPVVAVFACRIYTRKHLQAFYIDDFRHI